MLQERYVNQLKKKLLFLLVLSLIVVVLLIYLISTKFKISEKEKQRKTRRLMKTLMLNKIGKGRFQIETFYKIT